MKIWGWKLLGNCLIFQGIWGWLLIKQLLINKEILFLLQNRLPLLYCSTITENWFNCTAVSTKLLLLLWSFYCHQCFFCIAVPMKFLLLLWSFYCFNNVPTALQFILQSDCQYDEFWVNGMWQFIYFEKLVNRCKEIIRCEYKIRKSDFKIH